VAVAPVPPIATGRRCLAICTEETLSHILRSNVMSTANIISIEGNELFCVVTFRTKSGDISYAYVGVAAAAILAGADPAGYSGRRLN